jgi:putative transposase
LGNHWHFVAWPREDGQLTEFFRWPAHTHTHAQRWHAAHGTAGTAGTGHVYQGRFKSFPIECDEHLLTVLRYARTATRCTPNWCGGRSGGGGRASRWS